VAALAIWQFSGRYLVRSVATAPNAGLWLSLVYALLDFSLLLLVFAHVVRKLGQGRQFVPMLLLALACFCLVPADLLQGYVVTYAEFSSGSPIDLGWVLFSALGGLAALQLFKGGGDAALDLQGAERLERLRTVWTIVLTYVWIGVALFVTIWALWRQEERQAGVLFAGVAAATVLAITRQIRVFNENTQLYRRLQQAHADLDRRVRERTAQLQAQGERLRESERKARATFDLTFGFIGQLTPDGLVVEANRSALEFAGVQLSDVVGKPFWETPWWGHSTEMQGHARAAVRAAAGGELVRFEATHRARDGTLHTIDVSLKPVTDETGRVVWLIAEGRDITGRKRVEEERQALQLQLIRRTQQLEAVRSVSAEVTRELDLDKVLRLISTRVGELVGNCRGGVALWDEANRALLVHVESGDRPQLQPRVKLGEGVLGKVAESREGLIVNDYRHWPGALASVLERTEIAAGMAEPLLYRDRLVGVIHVHTEKPGVAFTPEDQVILRLFADQAAIAIENARLYDELKRSYGRLHSLAARAAEAEEAERRRLARELHDQVGQNLSALGLNLSVLRGQLDRMPDAASHSRLTDSLNLVERTAAAIRGVMADLRPGVLDDYGLMAALRWLGEEVAARTGIIVDVQGEESAPRLAAPVENSLFRIAQEALTNVMKHAQASEVTVSVDVEDRIARLLIADNGIGFEVGLTRAPQAGHHWGLSAMAERAMGVGGRCRVESRPGKGTHVIVEVPI
jgi:PAS domain S-box-containing protein